MNLFYRALTLPSFRGANGNSSGHVTYQIILQIILLYVVSYTTYLSLLGLHHYMHQTVKS